MLLVGTAIMAAVVAAAYGESPMAWAWSLRLGLGGSLLVSAFGQMFALVGGWMIWRSFHRRT